MASFISRLTSILEPLVTTFRHGKQGLVGFTGAEDSPPPYNQLSKVHIQVDKQGISAGIKLVDMALEEFDRGNEALGLDIYLSGLDKIIMSLPNLKDNKTRQVIKDKFISLEKRIGILTNQTNPSSDHMKPNILTAADQYDSVDSNEIHGDSVSKFKGIGRVMTDAIVQCVVLFKQSPLPGLLYFIFSYFVHLILWVDHQFNFSEKIQNWGISCIKQLLAADEKYHLHEIASEAVFTLVGLCLKASIAYKEAPGYLRAGTSENNYGFGLLHP